MTRCFSFVSLALAASLSASLTACTDDPMVAPGGPRGAPVDLPSLEHGEAFAAAQLGAEVADVEDLRKEITPVNSGTDARLVVGRAFTTRDSLDATTVSTFVHVTNTGPKRLCYVHAESLVYQGADGARLKTQAPVAYLLGSVGEKDGLATDTCLAPGESGYVVDVEHADYDAISGLAFRLEAGADDYVDPVSPIEPGSIDASPAALSLSATNAGPGRAEITLQGGTYIAFDAQNRPLTVGLLGSCTPGAERALAPGASFAMCADAPSYEGHTELVEVRVSYADLATGPTQVGGPGGAQ